MAYLTTFAARRNAIPIVQEETFDVSMQVEARRSASVAWICVVEAETQAAAGIEALRMWNAGEGELTAGGTQAGILQPSPKEPATAVGVRPGSELGETPEPSKGGAGKKRDEVRGSGKAGVTAPGDAAEPVSKVKPSPGTVAKRARSKRADHRSDDGIAAPRTVRASTAKSSQPGKPRPAAVQVENISKIAIPNDRRGSSLSEVGIGTADGGCAASVVGRKAAPRSPTKGIRGTTGNAKAAGAEVQPPLPPLAPRKKWDRFTGCDEGPYHSIRFVVNPQPDGRAVISLPTKQRKSGAWDYVHLSLKPREVEMLRRQLLPFREQRKRERMPEQLELFGGTEK